MLNFSEAYIEGMAIHRVGSMARGDELVTSSSTTKIEDESILSILSTYFLSPFKQPAFFSLSHPDGVEANMVFRTATSIFDNPGELLNGSVAIANHLYNNSNHPNIKFGELYVVVLRDCIVEGEQVDALGVFKSESKETYLKIYPQAGGLGVEAIEGISINKLDKGCLIFNTEKEFGYKVVAIDRTNGADEALFWKNEFLGAKPREDDFYQTSRYMALCKDYVREVVEPEGKLDKADQALLLNKTKDFFTRNDSFSQEDFEQQVIKEPELIESFREYKESFQAEKGCNLQDSFTISVDAAKEANKFFKSVIKLDRNFHVYIHGGRDRVKKGFDTDRGLSYYTLFFDAEA